MSDVFFTTNIQACMSRLSWQHTILEDRHTHTMKQHSRRQALSALRLRRSSETKVVYASTSTNLPSSVKSFPATERFCVAASFECFYPYLSCREPRVLPVSLSQACNSRRIRKRQHTVGLQILVQNIQIVQPSWIFALKAANLPSSSLLNVRMRVFKLVWKLFARAPPVSRPTLLIARVSVQKVYVGHLHTGMLPASSGLLSF